MRCIKCGETRESEFFPFSLRISDYRCKPCKRKYAREYTQKHPEQNNANFKKWYSNNADKHYEQRLAYARANPQRHRAQGNALKAFPETQVCGVMGCFALGERHHDDYSQPYEIKWLCRKHHKLLRRNNKLLTEIIPLNL